MSLLLFDLDDTLLGNEMSNFIPVYLQALASRMSKVAEPGFLINTLLAATRVMVDNTSPERTLKDKFDAAFYPPLGVSRKDVEGIIDAFYVEDFPKLQSLTQFRPEAVSLVENVIKHGDQAGIATNPLFPRTAILQRLNWAGLPPEQVPFRMIPSYETFHFAKPNPAFFAEYLGQLGWPKVPVVMVGNDVDMDIGSARQLGLSVFWVTNNGSSKWDGPEAIPPHGELTDLISWMDKASLVPMQTSFKSPEAFLAVLRSTPAALDTLCRSQNAELERRPTPDEWSPSEVLCHLRDVDTGVNLIRLPKVVNEMNPFLPGQETDAWADERQYCQQDGMHALSDFIKARIQLIGLLENLHPEDWNRQARHAIFGPTRLRELVNIIVGHDILHVQQVYRALQTNH